MWKKYNADSLKQWIEVHGNKVLTHYTGNTSTFHKPFSVPGYTMYYFQFKDQLPKNKDAAKKMLDEKGWKQLTRKDGVMDPIYEKSEKFRKL